MEPAELLRPEESSHMANVMSLDELVNILGIGNKTEGLEVLGESSFTGNNNEPLSLYTFNTEDRWPI